MLSYYNEEGLFSPSVIVKKNVPLPKTMILSWQFPFESKLRENFSVKDLKSLCVGGTDVRIRAFEHCKTELGFVLIPAGGPVVAMVMEEMIVLGVENFVFIGSCGYLADDRNDFLIVPNKALRDEGISYHYIDSKSDFVDIETAKFTEKFLKKKSVPYRVGATWTTDAIYRETPSAVKEAKEKGCICVEMECASIMSVAKAKNVKAYQILFSADKLASESWNIGRLKSMGTGAYGIYLKIIIDFAFFVSSHKCIVSK